MTDIDLKLIEARLGITLPSAYAELMRTRAEELAGLAYQIRDVTHGWFEDLLWAEERIPATDLATIS